MHSQYIIVDNFYPNDELIYNHLYSMSREQNSGGNYSGCMTDNAFYTDEHRMMFYRLTGQMLSAATGLNGKFRFSLATDTGKQHIHFDPGNNTQWAAVVYMQKPEYYESHNQHGTYFWKHKRTGLTSIPLTQEGIEKYGWNSIEDLRNFLETDGMDETLWECTLHVPYRYNRLVMFRPWLFHSPGKNFGDNIKNCRILQTFFLS